MTTPNPLKAAWAEGRTAFGLWSVMPGSFGAELVAGSGVDYVCVDQQHGVIDYDSMVPMLQAIRAEGAAPITRVLSNDPFLIMKALDAGAWGVIVPLVNSAEDAARAVAACRYPPQGMRSYGPVRTAGVIGSRDPEELGGEMLCLVMVETRSGLDHVDEILRTPGLDGVYVGPSDLALSLGLQPTPRLEHAAVLDAVERVRAACDRHDRIAGLHCLAPEDVPRFAGRGFGLITAGGDLQYLRAALRRGIATARAS